MFIGVAFSFLQRTVHKMLEQTKKRIVLFFQTELYLHLERASPGVPLVVRGGLVAGGHEVEVGGDGGVGGGHRALEGGWKRDIRGR